jgi:hypothetical protein
MRHLIGSVARISIFGFLGLALTMAQASAQTDSSLASSLKKVAPSQQLWVTTSDGRELRGTLADVAPARLRLRTSHGVLTLSAHEVRRIEVKDGIADGAGKGALIGALAGGIPAALFIANYGECPCEGSTAFVAFFGLLGSGIGAGIGAGSDALLSKRVPIYGATPRLTIAPLVAPGRVAVGGSWRW